MQTSVNLQEPFLGTIYLLIIVFIVIVAMTIYLAVSKKDKNTAKTIQIKQVDINDKKSIKQKYINKLNELQKNVEECGISVRNAYQELSANIRHFVYEMTNIKVQNYTLEEINELDMPLLYELIQEYYAPEFSSKSSGDIKSSIDKTRKVIEKWN